MATQPLQLLNPATGCFMSGEHANATQDARAAGVAYVYCATNMRIEDRRWKVRHRWREFQILSAPADWSAGNTQGAIWHDPPGEAPGAIIESSGGKLFRINITTSSFSVDDISSGQFGRPTMRLAWLASGENYVIRTDRASPTQIFDGVQTTLSQGYNPASPATSGLPNFAGPSFFTDRFWVVNDDRDLIAGDFVHRTDIYTSVDLIRTRDQATDILAVSFPPPGPMGAIKSLHGLKTTRGGAVPAQTEILASTVNPGLWGVLGGIPRSLWPTTSMRRVVMDNAGPTGPWAAAPGISELLFRSPGGIQSIKYADQEKALIGNPMVNVGQEIKPLLDNDFPDDLLFASVANPYGRQRFVCTASPKVTAANWQHRGYVSASLQPGRTRVPEQMVWEGPATLPARMGEIIMFVLCATRVIALVRKPDGSKSLVEWTQEDGDDMLADGTQIPVRWQVLTRRVVNGSEYSPTQWNNAMLMVEDVQRRAEVKVSVITQGEPCYRTLMQKKFCNGGWDNTGIADAAPLPSVPINKAATWVQFLIEGTGSCTIDLALSPPGDAAPQEQPGPVQQNLQAQCCRFDPYIRA